MFTAPIKEMELPPEGKPSVSRCIRLIDMGTTKSENYGISIRKIMITHELCNLPMEDGSPFAISGWYTLSMHKKANLRKMLESWFGKKINDKEASSFDLLTILNKPAFINIVHVPSKTSDAIYANIGAIMPLPEGITIPKAQNKIYSFVFDNDKSFDKDNFNKLSEKLRERIKLSFEYKTLFENEDLTMENEISNKINPEPDWIKETKKAYPISKECEKCGRHIVLCECKKNSKGSMKEIVKEATEHLERPKTTNYDFLNVMTEQKKRVGETAYYRYLDQFNAIGYKHADEITIRQDQEIIYNGLLQMPDEDIPDNFNGHHTLQKDS